VRTGLAVLVGLVFVVAGWRRMIRGVRWADVRDSGRLGLLCAACLLASGAVTFFDWMFPGRTAGCSNPQQHDPRYFCPNSAHILSVWLLGSIAVVFGVVFALSAIRTRNKRRLAIIAVIQLALLGTLIWIAQEPSFHVHLR
jgi:hypothetical protein